MVKKTDSVHVRLEPEAHMELHAIAVAENKTQAEVAAEILHEALLGRAHKYRVAAAALRCAGFVGKDGER